MDNFQIRTAVPDRDYEQLAALLSQIWSDPVNPDGLREWDTTEDGRIMNRRMVLVDVAEKVVGYSSVFRGSWMENGRYPQALEDMEAYLTQSDPSDENWPDAQRIVRLLRDLN